jgi:hypothetical protein
MAAIVVVFIGIYTNFEFNLEPIANHGLKWTDERE